MLNMHSTEQWHNPGLVTSLVRFETVLAWWSVVWLTDLGMPGLTLLVGSARRAAAGPGMPSAYMDMASLGTLPKYTCGQLYSLQNFSAGRDRAKLTHEIRHNLARPTAWEAVMRIRCSKGLRISSFHGHFFIRSSDLLALPQARGTSSCASFACLTWVCRQMSQALD